MKVFIGMETSGMTRRACEALGHEAISCDLLPAQDGAANHMQMDVFTALDVLWGRDWWPDAAVFHPDCTYLTGSAEWAYGDGPYHQRVKPGTLVGAARRAAREKAVEVVCRIRATKFRLLAIENPVGHLSRRIGKPTQIVQPYEFGDDASKKTCLWLYENNELLHPRKALPLGPRCPGRVVRIGDKLVERWSNQTDTGQNRVSPSEDRWSERSDTYPGIARALAQWIDSYAA